MEILRNIILVPEYILLGYLGFSTLYFLVFATASFFYKDPAIKDFSEKLNVKILIPAYKEDKVIFETARAAIKHKSNTSNLEIIVIADSLKAATIEEIKNIGATILPVSFKNSTKSKSINIAMQYITGSCDYVVVLDADNIMESGFIDTIVCKLKEGFKIVQGHRTAKNSNTNLALLDGISEEVNNAIFRTGHRILGLSASLIGSGFACEFILFKELIANSEAVGGFDKELELLLLERKIKIGYAKNAIVLDEKIQKSDAFVNQRRRWLSAQFVFFRKNIINGIKQLFLRGNIDYFDKLIQFLVPPRILTLGSTLLLSLIHLGVFLLNNSSENGILLIVWSILFLFASASIIISIPVKYLNVRMLRSILDLPKGFLLTLLALVKIKGANKSFIHTEHGSH